MSETPQARATSSLVPGPAIVVITLDVVAVHAIAVRPGRRGGGVKRT